VEPEGTKEGSGEKAGQLWGNSKGVLKILKGLEANFLLCQFYTKTMFSLFLTEVYTQD
jgi:hypothetical protein